MKSLSIIQLKKGKEAFVKRYHPWIFSGALQSVGEEIQEGDVVEIRSSKDEFLCIGHYQKGAIAVRILSFKPVSSIEDLLKQRIEAAFRLRKELGFTDNPVTNAYRLINGEGDFLPGLIVDNYNGNLVLQTHSAGMQNALPAIHQYLDNLYASNIETIYDKSADYLLKGETKRYLKGGNKETETLENNHRFMVNWESGQKTGFFLDQRENRHLLAKYAKSKNVLNAYSYSGGFSIYALKAGAAKVTSVDSSANAIALLEKNIELNELDNTRHQSVVEDVHEFLKHSKDQFDLIVLDPPAFARNKRARHKAVIAYKRINAQAFKKLQPGGILFTFSCSEVVNRQLFEDTITAAAIESGRNIRVLHHLSQPADHPVNVYHPEGEYLKGLVLVVE